MDWLSGLKVMSNEQGQLVSENNLGRDGLFVPIFQLLVTQKEEKKKNSPSTKPPAPIGRFSTL